MNASKQARSAYDKLSSTTWVYCGYTLTSVKNPGWNSGTVWTATKDGVDGITAHTKRDLLRYIDHRLNQ